MELIPVDPAGVPEASGGYANALQVCDASQLLFISGQVPPNADR